MINDDTYHTSCFLHGNEDVAFILTNRKDDDVGINLLANPGGWKEGAHSIRLI